MSKKKKLKNAKKRNPKTAVIHLKKHLTAHWNLSKLDKKALLIKQDSATLDKVVRDITDSIDRDIINDINKYRRNGVI